MVLDVDHKKAYSLLDKINGLESGGVLIANSFFYSEYNIWHTFQQSLYEDCKMFTTGQYWVSRKVSFLTRFKNFILNLFLLLESLIAVFVTRIRQKRVLIYGLDRVNSKTASDFRTEMLYNALAVKKVPFTEYLRTIMGRQTVKKFFIRKRLAIYFEASYFLANLSIKKNVPLSLPSRVNFDVFENLEERKFAEDIIARYFVRASNFSSRVGVIKRLLSYSGARVSFMIDDARFWGEFLVATNALGIKTIAIQHGHFSKYHTGWLADIRLTGRKIAPEILLVWCDYWKKELERLGGYFDPASVIVSGFKDSTLKIRSEQKIRRAEGGHVTVLIPYVASGPKSEVKRYIDTLLQDSRITVFFKVRVDFDITEQLLEYGLNDQYHKNFKVVKNFDEVSNSVDVVAGIYSTFLYDALAYAKPIGIFKSSSDYGEAMVQNGVADMIDIELGNLYEQLMKVKNIAESTLQERLQIYFGGQNSSMFETLCKIVEKEIKKND